MKILSPTPDNVASCAQAIRRGELVGIPTETVYGVAADATNPEAVRRVYDLKKRPETSPLIVHLSHRSQVKDLAVDVPSEVDELTQRFWPGPLTIVLRKSSRICSEATGGRDTVALRLPAHIVAQDLIRLSKRPLAAPSANPFSGLSPTTAQDINEQIGSGLFAILDGGPCAIGVESTVIDMTTDPPKLLRPGGLSRMAIESVLERRLAVAGLLDRDKSPGMHPRHYAPTAAVRLVSRAGADEPALVLGEVQNSAQIWMPNDPVAYAAAFYRSLHRLDAMGFGAISIELPPEGPEWEAIHDRLRRASTAVQ